MSNNIKLISANSKKKCSQIQNILNTYKMYPSENSIPDLTIRVTQAHKNYCINLTSSYAYEMCRKHMNCIFRCRVHTQDISLYMYKHFRNSQSSSFKTLLLISNIDKEY